MKLIIESSALKSNFEKHKNDQFHIVKLEQEFGYSDFIGEHICDKIEFILKQQ